MLCFSVSATKNITFPQLRLRAVMTNFLSVAFDINAGTSAKRKGDKMAKRHQSDPPSANFTNSVAKPWGHNNSPPPQFHCYANTPPVECLHLSITTSRKRQTTLKKTDSYSFVISKGCLIWKPS